MCDANYCPQSWPLALSQLRKRYIGAEDAQRQGGQLIELENPKVRVGSELLPAVWPMTLTPIQARKRYIGAEDARGQRRQVVSSEIPKVDVDANYCPQSWPLALPLTSKTVPYWC